MDSNKHDLKKLCTGAVIKNGLSIHGAEAEKSKKKVTEWAKKIGLKRIKMTEKIIQTNGRDIIGEFALDFVHCKFSSNSLHSLTE